MRIAAFFVSGAIVAFAPMMAMSQEASSAETPAAMESEAEEDMTSEYWDQRECRVVLGAATRLRSRETRVCKTRREWHQMELENQERNRGAESGVNTLDPNGPL